MMNLKITTSITSCTVCRSFFCASNTENDSWLTLSSPDTDDWSVINVVRAIRESEMFVFQLHPKVSDCEAAGEGH